jgi:hypothetical protein
MDTLTIRYSTYYADVPPPQPRLANVSWAGSPDKKMEDGSEVQPWHCLPFVEGSTYGLELVYPFETECHVVAERGTIGFEWDFAKEPGGKFVGGEFRAFSPLQASQYYSLPPGSTSCRRPDMCCAPSRTRAISRTIPARCRWR